MTTPPADLPHDDFDPAAPHKPTDDHEEIYFQGSPMLRGSIGGVLSAWIGGLVLISTPLLWRLIGGTWPIWWVFLVCLLLGLIVIVIPVIFTRTQRYRISNYRIDYERGILSRKIDTMELWHVDDISFRQSLIDRILNVGTIEIVSNDRSSPDLLMRGLPNPRPLFDSLKSRIIAVKRQRGVIKMDMG